MTPDTWTIVNHHHDPQHLAQFNSVCTIANGYLGLKGNLPEQRGGDCPTTIIHGVYDELDMFGLLRASGQRRRWLDPAYFDTAGRSPGVANLPDPLFVRLFVGDREVSLDRGEVSDFTQTLVLSSGLYICTFDYHDAAGRTTRIAMQRFAALSDPHRVFMRYSATPLDHDAPLRILSGINAAVHANATRERQFTVQTLSAEPASRCLLRVRTPARGITVDLGVETTPHGGTTPREVRGVVGHDAVYTELLYEVPAGRSAAIDRTVVLCSSEDERHGVATEITTELDAAVQQGFGEALGRQLSAWQALWRRADVEIVGDDQAQRYLRFCLHHLIAAAPRFSDRLSVPVKLLSGDYYQGNTFYDTETHILPFYTFVFPEYARTCLNFRVAGLAEGRKIAAELSLPGAKLAWQAGPYGEECLGRWYRFTHTNIHINGDVANALMNYAHATGDATFLREKGLDLLVESARFYAGRAKHDAARNAYDLHDVAGPDEGHCESTNNFYTNYLAARTLGWAADVLDALPSAERTAVMARLNIDPHEPPQWRAIAVRLTLLFDPTTRLYEQYDGFYQLPPPPAELLSGRRDWFIPLADYQAMNQPDVVMALVMFRDVFGQDVRQANWAYYKDKSMNFSSMSFAINAIMAADVGDRDEAYEQFLITAGLDLDESLTGRSDTHAGLHGTALGGAWMAAVFGFGGVHLRENGLSIEPRLPAKWSALRFSLMLRDRRLDVHIDRHAVTITPIDGPAPDLPICVDDVPYDPSRGGSQVIPYTER
ncbi:MAG: glycosyl hydrolase family 65 protein [Phycisphaerae bacterium]|jgi:kojibiose phosphorylase